MPRGAEWQGNAELKTTIANKQQAGEATWLCTFRRRLEAHHRVRNPGYTNPLAGLALAGATSQRRPTMLSLKPRTDRSLALLHHTLPLSQADCILTDTLLHNVAHK